MSFEPSDKKIPALILIIGSGVFGLSTALALCEREEYKESAICVIDRLPFPAPDGASIDTSRIVRADYADAAYATLAAQAQDLWRSEWGSQNRYHEVGFSLSGETGKSDYVTKCLANVRELEAKELQNLSSKHVWKPIQALNSNEELAAVGGTGGASGSMGYLNMNSGWADAEASIRWLRKKVISYNRVRFITVGISRLLFSHDGKECVGVDLADGNFLSGDLIILAAGAWTPSLLDLRGRVVATGQVVAYIEITPEEAEALSKLPVQINMSTGMFFIPPPSPKALPQPPGQHSKGKFYFKIARHAYGYLNPKTIPNPEDHSGKEPQITVSVPHTNCSSPLGAQPVPQEALDACRTFLHTIIPPSSPFAPIRSRPWHATRICHYADTPTGDWLLDYHPKYNKTLFIATGGSGHAFKFLPVIGERIVDCVSGRCPREFVGKWGWKDGVAYEKWESDGSRSGVVGGILEDEMKRGAEKCGESKM